MVLVIITLLGLQSSPTWIPLLAPLRAIVVCRKREEDPLIYSAGSGSLALLSAMTSLVSVMVALLI